MNRRLPDKLPNSPGLHRHYQKKYGYDYVEKNEWKNIEIDKTNRLINKMSKNNEKLDEIKSNSNKQFKKLNKRIDDLENKLDEIIDMIKYLPGLSQEYKNAENNFNNFNNFNNLKGKAI